MAEMAGRRAVEMAIAGGPKPSQILTAPAFDNAIRALHGDRRLHQRGHPSPGAGRTRGRAARPGALRRALAHHAVPAQPAALRQISDGGLLLRRRPAGRPQGAAAAAARAGAERERPHAGRQRARRALLECRRHPLAGDADRRGRRPGHADAATSAPAAPSSRSPPPPPICSPTVGAPSSSRTTPTSTSASTTRAGDRRDLRARPQARRSQGRAGHARVGRRAGAGPAA